MSVLELSVCRTSNAATGCRPTFTNYCATSVRLAAHPRIMTTKGIINAEYFA